MTRFGKLTVFLTMSEMWIRQHSEQAESGGGCMERVVKMVNAKMKLVFFALFSFLIIANLTAVSIWIFASGKGHSWMSILYFSEECKDLISTPAISVLIVALISCPLLLLDMWPVNRFNDAYMIKQECFVSCMVHMGFSFAWNFLAFMGRFETLGINRFLVSKVDLQEMGVTIATVSYGYICLAYPLFLLLKDPKKPTETHDLLDDKIQDFRRHLSVNKNNKDFMRFLVDRFAVESLLFLNQTEKFQRLCQDKPEDVGFLIPNASNVMDTFIFRGSPNEVNLSNQVREDLIRQWECYKQAPSEQQKKQPLSTDV